MRYETRTKPHGISEQKLVFLRGFLRRLEKEFDGDGAEILTAEE
jgi:hypothetical protein